MFDYSVITQVRRGVRRYAPVMTASRLKLVSIAGLLVLVAAGCGNSGTVVGAAEPVGSRAGTGSQTRAVDQDGTTPDAEAPDAEAPAEEQPAEELPAEEAPTEDAPAEEAPAEEAPAEDGEAAPNPDLVRYMSMGDSLTQGVGVENLETSAFPALLAQRWRDQGCEVELFNVGISGSTVEQIINEQLPNLADFKPTLVTFQSGGNDIVNGVTPDQYRANVETVLEAATANGARVIVFAQNEWDRSPQGEQYGPDLAEQRAALDEVLIEEAGEYGAEFVDLRPLYKEQADNAEWVEDGLHPTPEAYDAWSAAIAEAVPAPCQ